jgi:DNA-binding CsgD family transcriptional regulator/tetratricopeptide (TPR) repeat protein
MARHTTLIGREVEGVALGKLLDAVRNGESRALVIRGEHGVGKTALLEDAIESASDMRSLRVLGVESEMELPFAGLHQLCAPIADRLERLPGPQRDALGTAFGLAGGPPPNRFLIGLAVLGLISDVAEERPLVCAVDDAQWLDSASAQALAFAARRLQAESIGLVFAARGPSGAAREPGEDDEFTGLPEMRLSGLGDDDARALLASAIPVQLDDRVRDRIVAETQGNPLGLLELPRGLTPAELAGGFGLPSSVPLADRIEQSILRQLRILPSDTRQLLLTAAADPLGDVPLLWRAANLLGLGPDAARPAQAKALIEFDTGVRFPHPLVRSTVYGAASLPQRQEVHRALAEATDPSGDPDRLAWHRSQAATGLDESMADELERSADRAQRRGGVAAAAAFLARATELTPDATRRGGRALAAAQAKFDAAAPETALQLVAIADTAPLNGLQRALLERLRGQIIFTRTRGAEAPAALLDAAKRLEPLDAGLARETHLEALRAAGSAGRLSDRVGVREVVEAAAAAPAPPREATAMDLLLDGLATRFTDGYAAGVAPLRRALEAFRREAGPTEGDRRWLWLSCPVAPEPIAPDLWDDESWHDLAGRAATMAREAGALTVLPTALGNRAVVHLHAGELAEASALIEEAESIAESTGNTPLAYPSVLLAAWRGEEAPALEMIERSVGAATAAGEGRAIGLAEYATALLSNGLGHYKTGLVAARRACEYEDLGLYSWALPELIEAAVRSDGPEAAAPALRQLEERTDAVGTSWALGVRARSRALLSQGEAAEALYREAIERLEQCRIAVDLARARLLYGEWLRRQGRRTDAREQLRTAHRMLTGMGAGAFAERARRELLATGETVRKRTAETLDVLTPQEAQIARLARDGLSNPEIGAQLFISPRTVQYHLRKVFAKLEITSRKQLGRVPPALLNPS